jgi:excisionase family DNA binding protein
MEKQRREKAPLPPARAVKIREAAAMLGICENSVRRLVDRDKLRAVRALRHVLIPVSEIERFLS